MVLALIMLAAVGSLVAYSVNESRSAMHNQLATEAFHLAERGVERAVDAVARNDFSAWGTGSSPGEYVFVQRNERLGVHGTSTNVEIVPVAGASGSFVIRSQGTSSAGGLEAKRAIKTEITKSQSSGNARPPLRVGNDFRIVYSDPPVEFHTVDASGNLTDKYGIQTSDHDPEFQNAQIYGSLQTATGATPSFMTTAGSGQTVATLRNSGTAPGTNIDQALISDGFVFNANTPVLPANLPVASYTYGNFQPGAESVQLGSTGTVTRIDVQQALNSDPKTCFYIKGEVHIVAEQTLNLKGRMNIEPGGKLIVHLKGSNAGIDFSGSGYEPDQFVLDVLSTQEGTITVHTEDNSGFTPKLSKFIGTINAPNQKVNIHSTSTQPGEARNAFYGYIDCGKFENTNGPVITAPEAGGGSDKGVVVTFDEWCQIAPYALSM